MCIVCSAFSTEGEALVAVRCMKFPLKSKIHSASHPGSVHLCCLLRQAPPEGTVSVDVRDRLRTVLCGSTCSLSAH